MELTNLLAWLSDSTREIVAHLATNFIPENSDGFDPAALTECNFPGYAAIRITDWNGIDLGSNLAAAAESEGLVWEAGALSVSQQIGCVYLTVQEGSGPVKVWHVLPLRDPFIMSDAGQQFDWTVRVDSANLDTLQPVNTDV